MLIYIARFGFYGHQKQRLHEAASDDDDERSSSPESRAEEFAQRVLARSRKLLIVGGIVLGILIIIALVMAKLSGSGH
jgi:hypothetical protein